MFLALTTSVESQLRDAYAKRHAGGLDNQTTIANRLGIDRSAINRRLLGRRNMTLETIADMAWALGQSISVRIFNPYEYPTNEKIVISEHAQSDGVVRAVSTANDVVLSIVAQ